MPSRSHVVVTLESEMLLTACVMPTPPGVNDTVFARELPPTTDITVWNVTGIPYAARKIAITISFATHDPNDGSRTLMT